MRALLMAASLLAHALMCRCFSPTLSRAGSVGIRRLGRIGAHAAGEETSIGGAAGRRPSRAVLARGKARLFRDGHPLVYGRAVARVEGREPKNGDMVLVVDGAGNEIGWGAFNAHSMFRVRILCHAHEGAMADLREDGFRLAPLVEKRFRAAIERRRRVGLPSSDTTAYRLVNGEGDRLGGLVVDVFDSVAVLQASALWCEVHRADIESAARSALGDGFSLVWQRSEARLKQDGWEAEPEGAGEGPAAAAAAAAPGADDGIVVRENGFKYIASPAFQKTGFYCDQRDNRALLGSFIREGDVVADLCCFSGGFAMHAVQNGAAEVVAVDSSSVALDLSRRNAELNGPAFVERIAFEKGDVAKWMVEAKDAGRSFDVVVLDPPKLAPSRSRAALDRAKQRYRKLNAAAMRILKPGGLLVTCSCSAAMTQSGDFLPLVQQAARAAGREITTLKVEGAAPDHTLNPCFPEGEYLTAAFLLVD